MRAALILPLAALLLSACGAAPAPRVSDALAPVAKAKAQAALRVALAPIEVAPEAARRPRADSTEYWAPISLNTEELADARANVKSALEAGNGFAAVDLLAGLSEHEVPRGGALPDDLAFRIPDAASAEEVQDAAFKHSSDVSVTVRILQHRVRYDGRNGWWVPNIGNFFFGIWTAWFVADEKYVGELTLEVEARAVGSGRLLLRKRYEESVLRELDHFQRGVMLTGIFTVPGWLEESNYREASKIVLALAWDQALVELAADAAALGADLAGPRAAEARKTLAVTAGVGRSRAPLDVVATADQDERAFAALLRERAQVPARNILELRGAEPSKADLLAKIEDRARRARPGDTVIVYISGAGFAAEGECWIAPSDLEPSAPTASAVSLAEIGRRLDLARGARQVVILDASFALPRTPRAQAAFRTVALGVTSSSSAAPAATSVTACLERFARGRTVILACAPDAAAPDRTPAPEERLGLLTASLAHAAAAAANDLDRDGAITLAEAFPAAQREARRLSKRAGLAQVPCRFGDAGGDVVLGRPGPGT